MPLAICATPIGNLDDVTLRVLAELREADVVLAEDTRHTRGLLERHGIEARLVSYHEHNEAARVAELLPRLLAGERVALVSDAGLPGVSDPGGAAGAGGARRRRAPSRCCRGRRRSRRRSSRAGSSASATRSSGFLPRREAERAALWVELESWSWPIVAFESPQRLGASLRSLAGRWPEREVAVCRELTKQFEEVVRGTAAELAERFAAPPRGEITVVVGPGAASADPGRPPTRCRPSPISSPPEHLGGLPPRSCHG